MLIFLESDEHMAAALAAKNLLGDSIKLARASARIHQRRPTDFRRNDKTGLLEPVSESYVDIGEPEIVYNVKTTVGIDFLFAQGYGSSPGANGLNYIALSNDTVTETTASTTLSNEIALNGLARAQGTYAHTGGAATATIDKTFTCITNPQAAQKAALFSAAAVGTMNHVLGFTQRSLQVNDTLQVTFTITLT
jgi:hypothetical protein